MMSLSAPSGLRRISSVKDAPGSAHATCAWFQGLGLSSSPKHNVALRAVDAAQDLFCERRARQRARHLRLGWLALGLLDLQLNHQTRLFQTDHVADAIGHSHRTQRDGMNP